MDQCVNCGVNVPVNSSHLTVIQHPLDDRKRLKPPVWRQFCSINCLIDYFQVENETQNNKKKQ